MSNMSEISHATARNWERLGTDPENRLTSRANKRKSLKRLIPAEYLRHRESLDILRSFVQTAEEYRISPENAVYSLCVNFLRQKGIFHLSHVKTVMGEYEKYSYINELSDFIIPENEFDFIGAAYQSLLCEGKKNIIGSYYTPEIIAADMTRGAEISDKSRFLDPCCGSGAFLLASEAADPKNLYGSDIDPVAVMTAKTNLLCRYSDREFIPNIYCGDYLNEDIFPDVRFGFIAANPPWGAASENKKIHVGISSGETFSCFFAKAFSQLSEGGKIRFLFPEAILNVRAHRDIREFILNNCRLERITRYDSSFSGVLTGFADIRAGKNTPGDSLDYVCGGQEREIPASAFRETKNLNFMPLSQRDMDIIRKVRKMGSFDLSSSVWALGIVTGDNRGKLLSEHLQGTEPVFTGKEIFPYRLMPPVHYIRYDRAAFQQAAKEEIYRAPEKLVYRFISDRLMFAYDDSGRLFLNSANIIIPDIPGMSAKTVMAFLNSPLYGFLYKKLFGEIKILKGNLSELPFPRISSETDREISSIAEKVMLHGAWEEEINGIIYRIFGLDDEEICRIEELLKKILKTV